MFPFGDDLFYAHRGNVYLGQVGAHVGITLVGTYHKFPGFGYREVNAGKRCTARQKYFTQVVINWKKRIEDLIQGGITAGEFKTGIDITQTALSIIALIEGGIMIAKVTNTPANLDKVLKTVDTIIKQLKTNV